MHKKLKIFSLFGFIGACLIGLFAFNSVNASELPVVMEDSDITAFESLIPSFSSYQEKVYNFDTFVLDDSSYSAYFDDGQLKYDTYLDLVSVGQATAYSFTAPLSCLDYLIVFRNSGSTDISRINVSFSSDDMVATMEDAELYSMALPSNTTLILDSGEYIAYTFTLNSLLTTFRDNFGVSYRSIYNFNYSQIYLNFSIPTSQGSFALDCTICSINTLNLLNQFNNNSYNSGYDSGYANGYSTGYSEGQSTGYTTGYSEGQSTGYTSGYNVGYSEGQASVDSSDSTITSLFGAIVDIPITVLNSLTDATFNNVPIVRILITLFTLFLILYLIKRFIKR